MPPDDTDNPVRLLHLAEFDVHEARQPKDQEQQSPTLLLQRIDTESLYCPAPPGAGKSNMISDTR